MTENEEHFIFEDLKVYEKALDFIDFVYVLTRRFPKEETYGLQDQFRRAAISICLNIAEGSGGSRQEFCRFIKISIRSLRECVAIGEIACRQGFLASENRKKIRKDCAELSRMLSGLIKSLHTKKT